MPVVLSRQRYEQLIRLDAILEDLRARVKTLEAQVIEERQRAENAIDSMLAYRGAAPISVPEAPREVHPPYDDDPAELAGLLKRLVADPLGTLTTEGAADGR